MRASTTLFAALLTIAIGGIAQAPAAPIMLMARAGVTPPVVDEGGGAGSFTCEDTHTAAAATRAALVAALAAADADDCVHVPAGSYSITSGISWSAPARVTIYGDTTVDRSAPDNPTADDQTVFVDNIASGSPVLEITTDDPVRVLGITIRGGTGALKEAGMMAVQGDTHEFVAHDLHIDKTGYSRDDSDKLFLVGGKVEGVIYNSWGECQTDLCWFHIVNGYTDGAGDNGDTRWTEPTAFGTSDFIFLEDITITGERPGTDPPNATFTDCNTGGKFVIRYSAGFNANVAQTHPTTHGGDDRGCRAFEVYGVTSTSDYGGGDTPNWAFFYNNSGPALMWGNNVGTTSFRQIVYINNCRSLTGNDCGYSSPAPPNGWGICGSSSAWDGNTLAGGAPCIDAPGRGQGDLINGVFPSRVNVTRGNIVAWPRNALEPIYEWSTTGDATSGWGNFLENNDTTTLVQNRDFYLHHGNSSCNAGAGSCTAGVGVGTLAQRPANCTTGSESGGGVAWWATDQGGNWNTSNGTANDGALYKCTATNTWTLYYTPYTYPHPLRGS